MTALVVLAALVALFTHPHHGYDVDADGNHHVNRPPASAHIAWALVCLAMIAGLVVLAVLR